jgi:hypothetical protein
VQIALDPAAFRVGGLDDVGAAAGQGFHPLGEFLAAARAEQGPGRSLVRPADPAGQPRRGEHDRDRENRQARAVEQARVPGQQQAHRQHRQQPAGRDQRAADQAGEQAEGVVAELPPGGRGPQRAQRPRAEAGSAQRRRELQAERGVQPGPLQRGLPQHQPGQHEGEDQDGRHVQRDVAGVVALGGDGEDRRAPEHERHADHHRGDHGDHQPGQRVAGGPPGHWRPQLGEHGRGMAGRGREPDQQPGPQGGHDVTV